MITPISALPPLPRVPLPRPAERPSSRVRASQASRSSSTSTDTAIRRSGHARSTTYSPSSTSWPASGTGTPRAATARTSSRDRALGDVGDLLPRRGQRGGGLGRGFLRRRRRQAGAGHGVEAARFDELQHVGQRQPVVPRLELLRGADHVVPVVHRDPWAHVLDRTPVDRDDGAVRAPAGHDRRRTRGHVDLLAELGAQQRGDRRLVDLVHVGAVAQGQPQRVGGALPGRPRGPEQERGQQRDRVGQQGVGLARFPARRPSAPPGRTWSAADRRATTVVGPASRRAPSRRRRGRGASPPTPGSRGRAARRACRRRRRAGSPRASSASACCRRRPRSSGPACRRC